MRRILSAGDFAALTFLLIMGMLIAADEKKDSDETKNSDEGKAIVQSSTGIERGAKLYIAPIEGGFDIFLTAALIKKQVPVTVVTDHSKADYEITGISESEKAGWAKMLFTGSQQSRELASIKVVDLKSGDVVYGYAVHKGNSFRGKQSAAESCAKHLKANIIH
jgi:hypothetical protein